MREQEKKDPDFPVKRKARAKVNNAVRDGRMKKPDPSADFHHTEYNADPKAKPKGSFKKRRKHRTLPNSKDGRVKR